ncbi:flavin reductase family protein [Nocardioides carbamazepini]|uniref:flavin reductase family protein n=1 Tax=Nocardioides carbamazepini TaxID=2854259 RepID=UPI002149A0E3|nr:flavin reductase family protein [Nocardioides carbamazepini]MCR1785073.1 flavin reductase family protein [Nocardioides carbamazepini]
MTTVPSKLSDTRALRDAFACFPSGVTAVCAVVDGEPVGLAASSFTTVSLDPPLVSVCAQNTSSTWPQLRAARRLGISVLGEHQQDQCRQLARKGADRFAGLDWSSDAGGAVLLDGAPLRLSCAIESEIAAGDHSIVVLRIHDLQSDTTVAPLVFHGSTYRRLAS